MKAEFIAKAANNLQAAHLLLENGLFEAAVNRGYYSVFHAAIAALAHAGITNPKSRNNHKWVASEFVTQLIYRRKVYPSVYKNYIDSMRDLREIADYEVSTITELQARRHVKKTEEFFNLISNTILL